MFSLIELPYAPDALEGVISAQTLSFHHGKHLQAYVDNLNKLLPGTPFEALPLEEIVRKAPAGALFNNAGQVLNHNLYFTQFKALAPASANEPGWVWLSADEKGQLVITQEAAASNPVVRGLHPLLTFDVWEHAYYLDWQNRRAAHLAALWQIVDWKVIEERFSKSF